MQKALLELVKVTRRFASGDKDAVALNNITLRICAGEFVAIMGASGSGKSTLMNILGCLDPPSSGHYRIGGRETAALGPDELAQLRRARFGFIFQRYHLLPHLTAAGNVEIPAVYADTAHAARQPRALELLRRLGLAERAHYRPAQLSGGQQQRVSIARALMNGGEIILADEPTGALDSKSGQEVMNILHELNANGHTVILVTHAPQIAAHAQRIIELKDGAIVRDHAQPTATRPMESRAFFSRLAQGASAKTVCTIRRARSDTGKITEKCSKPQENAPPQTARRASARFARFTEAFKMAASALRAHRLRTFLTMLGIIIGITSVASIVALGSGMKQRIQEIIQELGPNTLSIFPGRDRGERHWRGNNQTLVPADLEALRAQPYVDSVTPETGKMGLVRYRNLDVNAIVTGVGEDFFRVRNLKLAQGIAFGREDIRQQAQVAVIDQNTREKLFSDMDNPLGQIILIGPVPCTVIGVTQSKKDIFGDQQNLQIWIPYSAANSKLLGQSYFGKITVRLRDGQSSKSAEHSIEELLAQRHGDKDFFIFNMDSMLKAGQQQNQLIRLFLLSIAVISLIVGGIGVMNIMLVSVTERTREIGIRMAVGARQSDILQQFLVEAVAVCLSGGLIGILLSFGIGAVFSALVEQMKMIFSVGSIIAAALCSTLIGVVFGFMPARNAARLNPVDALARD
ncbi:MacB family efflux pump subunit [Candidatus Glomeribacter gigasporarum]|uniref:MacB family efflux pump subunit n=1 Tax=Candidatus Glomeribacter gigasporarum TaxID=132144 RepID=UPI0005B2B3DF|nr:MacB family efflux pump subunit [Candidatus Glomeribacter gigasporarum]